jgi:hypothetical protein
MRRHRMAFFVLALCAAALVSVNAPAVTQGPTQCTATFDVLHNDRIGSLRLPEGSYQLRTFDLGCARASHLFAEFLQDYNGDLPNPWHYTVQGTGRGTFIFGDAERRFVALRVGDTTPGTPGHASEGGGSHGELACTSTFRVQHDDRIGPLRLRAGQYRITRLGARLSCGAAAKLLARFLDRPSGRLGGGWIVLPQLAEFVKGSSYYGFQVKRVGS